MKRAKRQLLIHVSRLLDQCSGCKNNVRMKERITKKAFNTVQTKKTGTG